MTAALAKAGSQLHILRRSDGADKRIGFDMRAWKASKGAGLLLIGPAWLVAACGGEPRDRADQPVDARQPLGDVIGLPDNSSLVAPAGSTERQLADFLASAEPPPRTFTFDRNQFQPWSDTPGPRTRATTVAVIQILRAYPRARVTIAGYTDDVGGRDANMRLSQSRADIFRDLLKAGGIPAHRITTIGKGPADPIGDNATEEGRALNRRLELIVTAK